MATKPPSIENAAEDDYIDMDISSATLLCCSKCSPQNSIEFEFQMSSKRETNPSPADELFYKGKLLPLHLPPRLQMVENLIQNRVNDNAVHADTATSASANTSRTNSCYASGELNPEDYFRECSSSIAESQKNKTWSKKLKSMKESNLGLKLKASRAYIKSLFTKSEAASVGAASKAKSCSGRYPKEDLNPYSLVRSIERERLADEEPAHRKSFSGAINWHSAPKSSLAISSCSSTSSSFSSVNSGGFYGPLVLKRSSSVDSEVESAIEGAIAHCKKSQQPARKSVSDVGYSSSLTASKIAVVYENKEKPGICRG